MKKAFIFTIDGLIALMLAVILFITAGYLMQQFSPPKVSMLDFAQSSLEMLDASGDLQTANSSPATIQQYLDALPPQYCAGIRIFSSGSEIQSINKTGCAFSAKQSVALRGFYAEDFYVAQMIIGMSGNGSTVATSAVINGTCGLADGQSFFVAPSLNLCNAGISSIISGAGPWTWDCNGLNGGANDSCSASYDTTDVDGVCGSSDGMEFVSAPTSNLCLNGTASSVAGTGPWSWNCTGFNNGANASCSADIYVEVVNGLCGSANGSSFFEAPISNLCINGTNSSVVGSGPWDWNCTGINGGTDESCNANLSVCNIVASFDGLDDYISIPNDESFESSNFTTMFWVKISDPASDISGFVQYGGYVTDGWNIFRDNATGKVLYAQSVPPLDQQSIDISNSNSIDDGNWHHIALVFNSTFEFTGYSVKSYLDGVLHDSRIFSNITRYDLVSFDLDVAKVLRNSVTYMNGTMYDFMYFERPLLTSEIQNYYSNGIVSDVDNLTVRLLFNGTALDETLNHNDGTEHNGVTYVQDNDRPNPDAGCGE